MTKRNMTLLLLLFVFVLGGCTGGGLSDAPRPTASPAIETEPPPTPTPEPTPAPDPIGERVRAMTVEELVGQLLVAGIEGKEPGGDAMQIIEDLHVGGIILFGRNVESAGQLAALTNALKERNQRAGNVPVFLCVDEEGGMVSRMPPEVADLPNAYDYAQAGGDFYERGTVLAEECAAFGFHVDFAPVLDIWSNPQNTVIGKRACGTDAETAARLGQALADGLSDGGVVPVGKHFPGHGDTLTDSHKGLPVVDKTAEELRGFELCPYEYDLEAVMVGHIQMTKIDPLLPASLSPKVVTGLLREEMGFEGLVFTDDLTMGAVANTYGMGEATVKAILAGCDMALVCHGLDNAKAAYHALLFAVEDGTLSRERLEESARRILTVKEAYAVEDTPVDAPDVGRLNEAIRAVLP